MFIPVDSHMTSHVVQVDNLYSRCVDALATVICSEHAIIPICIVQQLSRLISGRHLSSLGAYKLHIFMIMYTFPCQTAFDVHDYHISFDSN